MLGEHEYECRNCGKVVDTRKDRHVIVGVSPAVESLQAEYPQLLLAPVYCSEECLSEKVAARRWLSDMLKEAFPPDAVVTIGYTGPGRVVSPDSKSSGDGDII